MNARILTGFATFQVISRGKGRFVDSERAGVHCMSQVHVRIPLATVVAGVRVLWKGYVDVITAHDFSSHYDWQILG